MHRRTYFLVNSLTVYRVLAAGLLAVLVFEHCWTFFRWMLVLSFFTDAVDGFLARYFKVTSKLGTMMDSIGDDLTVGAAILGMLFYRPAFLSDKWIMTAVLIFLYLLQNLMALFRYGKLSGFHIYTAKLAAVCQGVFFLCFYFCAQVPGWLFYAASLITAAGLVEEITLILLLRRWRRDVKGLYWVLRYKHPVHISPLSRFKKM